MYTAVKKRRLCSGNVVQANLCTQFQPFALTNLAEVLVVLQFSHKKNCWTVHATLRSLQFPSASWSTYPSLIFLPSTVKNLRQWRLKKQQA
jgi:hypothetical protein